MPGEAANADALALLARLYALLDGLVVRGLRAVGIEERTRLASHRAALAEMGTAHLAGALEQLIADLDSGRREGARTLLRTRASVRVFERLLSLRMVIAELGHEVRPDQIRTHQAREERPDQVRTQAPPAAAAQRMALLREVANAIEELLLAGTTTASQATQRTLSAAFEEAARAGFLRLGSSVRLVIEELKKFDSAPERFSGSRLAFFLDRAWLLSRAAMRAQERGELDTLTALTSLPTSLPVGRIEAATLGVSRRHVPGAFSAFEFRMRLFQPVQLSSGASLAVGTPLAWSLVLPARADVAVPPEAFLSLARKQGFRPIDLLERRVLVIEQAALSASAPYRLSLGPASKVSLGEPVVDWRSLIDWQPRDWLARLVAHRPDPLELPIELSEEVLLPSWQLVDDFAASTVAGREQSERSATLAALGLRWRLRVDSGESRLEDSLRAAARTAPQPALFASCHVEQGEAVLMPLALIDTAPDYCTVNPARYDKAALVRALNQR